MLEKEGTVDIADEAVPFRLVASGRHSRHGMLQLLIFRGQQGWQGHHEHAHQPSGWCQAFSEPDFSASMLVEVAIGPTSSSGCSVEITGLVLRDGVLRVLAALRGTGGAGFDDVGEPFVVVATAIRDGPVALDLSVDDVIVVELPAPPAPPAPPALASQSCPTEQVPAGAGPPVRSPWGRPHLGNGGDDPPAALPHGGSKAVARHRV
jgi:hypothetical protein